MAQVDAKLTTALKQAKTKPMCFVFVAKGNDGKLLVDKKKINAKEADAAKKECGGGTIYRGRCKGEEGMMVFEVGKAVSPTLNALTKKIIKQDAGLVFEVEYRVAADLVAEESQGAAEESQGESEGEGGDATAAAASPPAAPPQPEPPQAAVPPAPPQPSQGGAEVMKRLNTMSADIRAAMTGPNKSRVQALFVSVNGQIKNKDFVQASKTLDELGPLVAGSASSPAAAAAAVPPAPPQATAPSSPANDAALAAEWQRRVIALEPKVLKAQKTRAGEAKWMTMFMTAQDLGSDGDFAKSLAILDKLEGLLNAPKAPEVAAAGDTASPAKAAERWRALRTTVVAKLQDVIKEVVASKDPEVGQAELELKAVMSQLSGEIETKQQAAEMERYLKEDAVVADVSELAYDLKSPLLKLLQEIQPQLAA